MKQKKFDAGVEIPQGMQEVLLGGQGRERVSVSISISAVSDDSRDSDVDSDVTTSTTPEDKVLRP